MSAPQHRRFVTRWLPVLVWMTLIFIASSDAESGSRGSRLLAPILRWLMPDLAQPTLDQIVLFARKGVHFVTFGILATLAWRAFSIPAEPGPRPNRAPTPTRSPSSPALRALALTVLYAITDEWHQNFVPTRVGSPWDVVIDTAGAVFAVVVCHRLAARRQQRR